MDFADLKSEYENLWASAKVRPERAAAVDTIAHKLLAYRPRYEAVQKKTGVPWFVIAAWHNRESDADFEAQLAQGDPLDQVSHNEPAGRGPFDTWEESAIDALVTLKHLDRITDWTQARICYETERYNGFGYRNFHKTVLSPYLWSFTEHYSHGKYIGDGDFSSSAVDKQCGAIPIMKRLMELTNVKSTAPAGKSIWMSVFDMVMSLVRSFSAPAKPLDLAGRLDAAMKKRGYKLFTAPGECNIIYVEGMDPDGTKNDNKPNVFNDTRFVLGFDGSKPKILGAWEGTVNPGKYWVENRMNPNGAANIKFGQYTAWQLGQHHSHEAWVQTGGPVTVFRDDNEDFSRNGDKEDTGEFGINLHGGYDLPKNDLGRSSAGCLVGRSMAGHREFMSITKSDPRVKSNSRFVMTATVLTSSDV